MKLVVGVCGDDIVQVNAISSFLEKNINDYQIQVIKAFSGEELLLSLEEIAPDVVFLDVEMNGINGLQTGKKLREKYPKIIIIFITGHKKFALDAFKIKTMDYLVKPVTEKRIRILLRDLMIRLDQIKLYEEMNKTISFSFRDSVIKLKYDEIYFFEKNLRKITVYSEKGDFSFYESMNKLLSKLDQERFIHCHNSFLVNKSKILMLRNNSIYIKELDKNVPVSRKNRALVREVFEKNIFL